MTYYLFITRHQPSQDQIDLVEGQGDRLIWVGDCDVFDFNNIKSTLLNGYSIAENKYPEINAWDIGIVGVHPMLAVYAAQQKMPFGVFENGNRSPEGEKPSFYAKAFHKVSW